MTKSYLIIINPISGSIDKEPIIEAILEKLKGLDCNYSFFYTTGENDEEQIAKLLSNKKYERVIVAGGDGTVALAGKHLLNSGTVLGIIAAGSANGLAVNFGLPTDWKSQIDIAFSDSIISADTVTLNGHFGLHISDLGLNAELIKNYEDGNIRGKFGYFIQSIPTLFRSNYPFDYTIEANGKTIETTGALLAIANANKFGTGATINPDGKINDGLVELIIFKNLNIIEIAKTAQENPNLSKEFMEVLQTQRATITTEKPIPFQIDGEYMGELKKVEVRVYPHSLCIAVPEEFLKDYN